MELFHRVPGVLKLKGGRERKGGEERGAHFRGQAKEFGAGRERKKGKKGVLLRGVREV